MKRVTVRFSDGDYNEIRSISENHKISFNAAILKLIREYSNEKKELSELIKISIETQKIALASFLMQKESLKESSKSGFFTECYLKNDQQNSNELIEDMKSYIQRKEQKSKDILKDAGVL